MLVKLKKLVVSNEGYKRDLFFQNFYLNVNSVVSINDYYNINEFLTSEGSEYADKKYSLIKVTEGNVIDQVIVVGSAEDIHGLMTGENRKLLND